MGMGRHDGRGYNIRHLFEIVMDVLDSVPASLILGGETMLACLVLVSVFLALALLSMEQ